MLLDWDTFIISSSMSPFPPPLVVNLKWSSVTHLVPWLAWEEPGPEMTVWPGQARVQ